MKKFIALVLALVLVLSLCACGGNDGLVGKWEMTGIESAGMTTEQYEAILSLGGMKLSDLYIECKSDGTCVLAIFGDEEQTDKWEEKDGKYYIGGEEVAVSGNKFTISVGGDKMEFTRK